jgi:hypothetical protein
MREFALFVGLVLAGAVAGISYAYLSERPLASAPTAVAEAPEPAAKRKRSAAKSKRQKKRMQVTRAQRRATVRKLRAGAERFFARLDSLGCSLDPANSDLIVDAARYSMAYRLIDGSQKTLEMTGAEYKAFGLQPSRELNLYELECTTQGRFYKVVRSFVRVHEQRSLRAKQDGKKVSLQLDRTILVGPNAAGVWAIHEIAGTGKILR